jgi:hypothetical protein
MHKSATKCNETVGKWCINKHGASKIIDTLETYHWPSIGGSFYNARKTMCAGKTMMHGIQDNEDDDRPLSPTGRGQRTRGNFRHRFARVSFVRSPQARPGRPGMAWARRMDEGPDPGENEDPRARLGRFTPSG